MTCRPNYGIYRDAIQDLWLVNLTTQTGRPSRSFADRKYGGSEQALLAARAHRDSLLPHRRAGLKFREPPGLARVYTAEELRNISRVPSSTGSHGWRVIVSHQKKHECKNFPDAAHGGVEGALQAAQEYRDWLRSLLPAKKTKP